MPKSDKPHGNTGNKYAAKDDPKTSFLHVRCTPEEKGRWKQAAYPNKLAQWVTDTLNKASKEQSK